jgi:lipopolysaccharide/colanic/teichoic acid biosynthesis glycosyltransferase
MMSPLQETLKRGFDIFGTITALLLLSPIIVMALLLAALASGRPLLSRQRRYDINDRAFDIWQFRCTIAGPEGISGLSPLGQILRDADLNEALLLFRLFAGLCG